MSSLTKDNSDQIRFSQWAEELGPPLRGYIESRIGDSQTAEDLAQEVFCRAWQARDKYTDMGMPKAYLYRIADRLVIDWRRKKKWYYGPMKTALRSKSLLLATRPWISR